MQSDQKKLLEDLREHRQGPVAQRMLESEDGLIWFEHQLEQFGPPRIGEPNTLVGIDQASFDRFLEATEDLEATTWELMRLLALAASTIQELESPFTVTSVDAQEMLDLCSVLPEAWWPLLEVASGRLAQRSEADGEALLALGYRLYARVGRGGMGRVYRARQEQTGATVALKVIEAGGRPEMHARVTEEIRTLSRLDHPGISRLLGAEEYWGSGQRAHVLVLEFVNGRPITEHVQQAGLDDRERVQLFLEACRAVEHAHQRRLVHRDLHPGNILVDRSGRLRVIDFGISKDLDTDSGLTRTGALLGTPAYSAPEQLSGDKDALGFAADVYSLGAVLYVLTCGQPPHVLDHLSPTEALNRLRNTSAPDLHTVRPDVPADLRWITMKAIDPLVEGRYSSAGELAEDLQRFLDRRPVLARAPTASYRARRFVRRRPLVVVGALLISLSFLGTLVGLGFGWSATVRAAEAANSRLTFLEGELRSQGDQLELSGSWPRVRETLERIESELRALPLDDLHAQSVMLKIDSLRADELIHEGYRFTVLPFRERAVAFYREAVEVSPAKEFRGELALSLVKLGDVLGDTGDRERRIELYEEAHAVDLALVQEPGGERWENDLFWSYIRLHDAHARTDPELSRAHLFGAREAYSELDRREPDTARTLHALSILIAKEANAVKHDSQRTHLLDEGLAVARELVRRDATRTAYNEVLLAALERRLMHPEGLSSRRRTALMEEAEGNWRWLATTRSDRERPRLPSQLARNADRFSQDGELGLAASLAISSWTSACRGLKIEPESTRFRTARYRAEQALTRVCLGSGRVLQGMYWAWLSLLHKPGTPTYWSVGLVDDPGNQ